jgi:FAD/FMN-containing dehydrogenase
VKRRQVEEGTFMTAAAPRHPTTNDLRGMLSGDVLVPADTGYEAARSVFNAMIDRRPEVIVLCETADDVAVALRHARERDLEVAVRGGGHSVAGMSTTDGGLVVDLRRMRASRTDPEHRTVRVEGGATMSDLDRATEPYGLATTGGRVSTTGVGGFTLGGGSGWLERKFGLACDNLESVELVTADGTRVRASEEEHRDLFWALHGGGGNFGVATALTFRLHPLPAFTVMLLLWPPEAGADVVPAYRDFMQGAPDEVGGGLIYFTAPPEPFVPEHLVGRSACAVLVAYAGPEREARAAAEPLLGFAPEGEMIAELPYADLQCMLDDPPGLRNYWSAEYLRSFPDEAVDRFLARADGMLVPSATQHVLFPQGGAVARGPADYPVPWRQAAWTVHPFGLWEDPADDGRGMEWARAVRADMQPWAMGAVNLNFIGSEGRDRVTRALGTANQSRLAAVKARYDPDNVLHLNHNIHPSRTAAAA